MIELRLWAIYQQRNLPKDKLAPEGGERVEKILKRLETQELPRLWQRTITRLANTPTPECQKLIDLLRKSNTQSLVQVKAQKAYQENRERK